MRVFVIAAALIGATAPAAIACPPLDACVVKLPSTVRSQLIAPAPAPRLTLTEAIRSPLLAPKRVVRGEVEMPWIWQTLRERVYSRMPSYEQEQDFKIVLAPVVVTSPSDTVPGVGLAGDF